MGSPTTARCRCPGMEHDPSWGHVDDLAEAMAGLHRVKTAANRIYNCPPNRVTFWVLFRPSRGPAEGAPPVDWPFWAPPLGPQSPRAPFRLNHFLLNHGVERGNGLATRFDLWGKVWRTASRTTSPPSDRGPGF
ncbi:MAG: hypothetical protein CM15mP77_1950 [Synechococcus sp.]|nr:MAG: hypothetical protein CM15mP77_1950 [Synechococcus sp.]